MMQSEELESSTASVARKGCTALTRALDFSADFLESHPWILILTLGPLYAFAIHQHIKPLWYDELFTYYISNAPSFRQMILWTHQVDLNPPLYYILARFVFHLWHPSAWAVRLPALILYFTAALSAYKFVSTRSNSLYGFLSAVLILGSTYNYYAVEARPYALLVGFLGVAAVSWQITSREDQPRRWLAILFFVVAAFCMLLSHVLGMIAYGAFMVGELARFFVRRRADWPLWTAILLPLLSYFSYRPLLQSHSVGVYPPAYQASIEALYQDYSHMWNDIAPFLAIAMIVIILIGYKGSMPVRCERTAQPIFPEVAFAINLVLVPMEVIVLFMRSHSQFFPRYGISSVFGVAILIPYLIAWWTAGSRHAALIASAAFTLGIIRPASAARILQAHLQPPPIYSSLSGRIEEPLSKIDPGLPFVDSSGLTFLEMDNREDSLFLSRVYFLVDPQAAMEYAHANGFNNLAAIKRIFPVRANVEQYDRFISDHRKFIVLGTYSSPDDWLLRKLVADGEIVRFLGNFHTGYIDENLYEVTITRN